MKPDTQLGPYELLAPIGSGGMGEVWKARDTRLSGMVAIKTVKEQQSERFKQEAHAIAALNHPYICQLFDIGPDYLVLEYIEGKPLSGPLPEREAVRLAIQIATALEAAHKKGIIHRDLKPANILVTEEGSVKLLDFGLAKLYEQDTSVSSSPTADYPATKAGAVLGTVAYMSPEQAQSQQADVRSDIFSFGLVLYEMLSGRRAFSGNRNFAVMTSIVKEDPLPLQASPVLEKIVRRCLTKQPSGRYQRMSDVWFYYGRLCLTPMQRYEEAMIALQKAMELDPLSSSRRNELGYQYVLIRQYDRAIEHFRNALEIDPHDWACNIYLGFAYLSMGRIDEALPVIENAVRLSGRNPLPLAGLGLAYSLAGRISEAQKLLEELQKIAQKANVPPMAFAIIYCGLKEIDRAFGWFEEAIETRDQTALVFCVDPLFDPLRSHPRYHALLRKMNLEA